MSEKTEKQNKIAREVMLLSRNALLVNLRFLDSALSQFELVPIEQATLLTDGKRLFYGPLHVLESYKTAKEIPVRDYLHIVMHCVFRHMYMDPSLNRYYWDLACDIAVENVITELGLSAVRANRERQQAQYIAAIKKELKYVTAEKIYSYLRQSAPEERRIAEIRSAFFADDHAFWYMTASEIEGQFGTSAQTESAGRQNHSGQAEEGQHFSEQTESAERQNHSGQAEEDQYSSEQTDSAGKQNYFGQTEEDQHFFEQTESAGRQNRSGQTEGERHSSGQTELKEKQRLTQAAVWENISRRIQVDLETFGKQRGLSPGAMTQNLAEINREKYDYTAFLKKFAVMGETMKVNDDEFDYIFYTYGLQLYENMPLIEPLEYKEVKAIREFVIAIDTSGSTSGELVQKFIQKTYNILKSTESFFTKINLHIIQCDEEIQEDKKITCQEDFDEYLKTMQIRGMGGTDFCPVFEYVEQLRRNKEFTNLKGLIYFTDGYGVFPAKKPDYDAAFVFVEDEYNNPDVPPWAIKLVLQKDEI